MLHHSTLLLHYINVLPCHRSSTWFYATPYHFNKSNSLIGFYSMWRLNEFLQLKKDILIKLDYKYFVQDVIAIQRRDVVLIQRSHEHHLCHQWFSISISIKITGIKMTSKHCLIRLQLISIHVIALLYIGLLIRIFNRFNMFNVNWSLINIRGFEIEKKNIVFDTLLSNKTSIRISKQRCNKICMCSSWYRSCHTSAYHIINECLSPCHTIEKLCHAIWHSDRTL